MKLRVLTILTIGFVLFLTRNLGAQETESSLDIRVEAHEVVVPVFVFVKKRGTMAQVPHFVPPAMQPRNEADEEILGLEKEDFRVFEDGEERRTLSVCTERLPDCYVSDNISVHDERSCTPDSFWIGPDVPERLWPSRVTEASPLHVYQVAFVPKDAALGSCHHIDVKVQRRAAKVFLFRDRFCHSQHSPSDTLDGTVLGESLWRYSKQPDQGTLPLYVQSGTILDQAGQAVVEITAEFPWKSLRGHWSRGFLNSAIGILGLIYDIQGKLVMRFSASPCESKSSAPWEYCNYCSQDRELLESDSTPTQFETQLRIPPGEYRLKIVVGDGVKFGKAESFLQVHDHDTGQVANTSPILCKRFHEFISIASKYLPLVTKAHQFQPAGDTRFHKGDVLFAFFDVYDPLLGSSTTKVNFELKLTDMKTGEVKADTGQRPVDEWIKPGSQVIPIEQQIAIDKLPAGSYRVQVRASDSAGRTTAWREAEFSVLPD